MGNQPQKPQPIAQPRDTMDVLLDLRMTKKRLESESKRSQKESEKNIQKAKEALKKNNEEGARLFLQTATSKKAESTNLMKMAQKIEFVEMQVKSSQANQQMITQLNRVTPLMNQYTQQMPTEQLYQNITQFDNALDDLMVQGKVMDSMMNKNQDYQTNMQVDAMMQQMKQEQQIGLEELNPQGVGFQPLTQQQQQFNQQQQQQQQQKY